jgi:hypothetical protein
MNRRKLLKIAAGAIAGSGAGIFALSNAFKPEHKPIEESQKLQYINTESGWEYNPLDPDKTAELAYKYYESGSCMYAIFNCIISQLADKYGEPYVSFPVHMMKYGHGGIGGFGTTCGALNGASALIGLLVSGKTTQDSLITGLFRWYEKAELPEFKPQSATFDFTPPSSISESTICHASNTNWVKKTGYKVNSDERRERCRRLTSDVAYRLTVVLNKYISNNYLTDNHEDETVHACMTCHSDKGKLGNTSARMGCASCHTESAGHKIFADVHYKLMKTK